MKKYHFYLDQFNFSLTLRRDITGSPNSRNEVTRDLSAGRVDDALQATVENKRLCMRNKILRSSNA